MVLLDRHSERCRVAERSILCRVQAAINAGTIKDVFKTQRCFKNNCKRLHCTYYHDESDKLQLIGYKAQYCIAYKVRLLLPWLSRSWASNVRGPLH